MDQPRPGQTVYYRFATTDANGNLVAPTGTPTVTVARNNTDDGAVTSTPTSPATGWWIGSVVYPGTYVKDDHVIVRATALIGADTCPIIVRDDILAAAEVNGRRSVHVGEMANNVITAAAIQNAALTAAKAHADLIAAIQSGLSTSSALTAAASAILDSVEADFMIDTAPVPWQLVWKKRSDGTELFRKNLKDASGGNVVSATTLIGQMIHP